MNKYSKRLLEEWIQHGKIIISVERAKAIAKLIKE